MAHQVMQTQNGTNATMNNKTATQMTLSRSNNWAGSPAGGKFPDTIPPGQRAMFSHLKGNSFGSKAAVQYDGSNASGIDCSWLMAWDAPADNTPPGPPNRVYSACGAKAIIDAMSWDQILMNLDIAQQSTISNDQATKTGVDATIHEQVTTLATLVSNFKVIP